MIWRQWHQAVSTWLCKYPGGKGRQARKRAAFWLAADDQSARRRQDSLLPHAAHLKITKIRTFFDKSFSTSGFWLWYTQNINFSLPPPPNIPALLLLFHPPKNIKLLSVQDLNSGRPRDRLSHHLVKHPKKKYVTPLPLTPYTYSLPCWTPSFPSLSWTGICPAPSEPRPPPPCSLLSWSAASKQRLKARVSTVRGRKRLLQF